MSTITFRRSNDHDRRALERLATLDSSRALTGAALVAEQDGSMIAAVALDGRSAIADPFKPTAALVTMLRSWSAQLA